MKLIKTLLNLETQFLNKIQHNEIYAKTVFPLGVIALASEIIWIAGPHFIINDTAPLASPEKRVYVMLCLFLIWIIKLFLFDLDTPKNPLQYRDKDSRNKLNELQKRFDGAVAFLKKTTVTKLSKTIKLNDIPWYLLIGPAGAGKTTLLANADCNYVLQRQFANTDLHAIEASHQCDWWVTREACLIDVPGRYLKPISYKRDLQRESHIWRFFLRLIRNYRGKRGISGIIITLPAADIIKQNDVQAYHGILRELFQRVHAIQAFFPEPIPCQLVLTKCDLLPGFKEFFAESSQDELTQAWGIHLPTPKQGEKLSEIFTNRFNALIKKINQQLLWRLHHERNPIARPYIKDFPLQIERVKEFTVDFLKKFSSSRLPLTIQGVYLTSAIQPQPSEDNDVIEANANTTERAIQIFKEPTAASRPYFIKQFLQHGLEQTIPAQRTRFSNQPWKHYAAYAASFSLILLAGGMLGKDFQQGVKQAYVIQKDLADYQVRIASMQDPLDHLIETINLLNTLQQSVKNSQFQFNLKYLLSYYSNQSEKKAVQVYQAALHSILMPEVKNYFEEYLKNPVNKDADDVYAVLKAYLMIGDTTYLDANHISNTMWKVLPKSIMESESTDLMNHLNAALHTKWSALSLNEKTIKETRNYLSSLPKLKLSYIILKNIDNNNTLTNLSIGTTDKQTSILNSQQLAMQIPAMFTAKAFNAVVNQETILAAQEATTGNWVLGHELGYNDNAALAKPLIEQLRTTYLNNYVDVWESLLANINLTSPGNLAQIDAIIMNLMSTSSPLIQFLSTLHDNTYFEPIISSSPRLQNIGALVDKNTASQKQLYDIFASLQSLHQYLQPILSTDNQKKIAFEMISSRMLSRGTPDAITQVRMIAERSPEPVKNWLVMLASSTSTYLLQEASRYIDTSWQTNVIEPYQTDIANRFPFSNPTSPDVDINKFIQFFGNPGTVISFYNNYLQKLIDQSTTDWHWKKIDNQPLPFSDETLRQIQHAMRIHKAFFPNGDNKIALQFSLQPYEFGKLVKKVKLSINDKQIIDEKTDLTSPHLIAWPSQTNYKMTSVQLTLDNNQTSSQQYPGNWGWFKLVDQSFESVVSKKELLLNLSMNEHPAKYLLYTDGKYNPFSSLNLRHFQLPKQLTEEK